MSDGVPEILSSRLTLVSLSPEALDALLTHDARARGANIDFVVPRGWPDEHDARFLRLRMDQMQGDPGSQQWLVRAMILRQPLRPMIGHIGFHGPPNEGFAELGYTVFAEHRRRGYAYEAAQALMGWARQTHGVSRFRVSISPENAPSLAMAAKMEFERVGQQIDEEDGLEYVFELRR